MLYLIPLAIIGWMGLFELARKGWKRTFVPVGFSKGGGGGGTTVTSHTYYYYKIKFPHHSIDPNQSILFYDAFGVLVYTLPPNYQHMNYGEGVLSVPGTEQNTLIESVSTATYYVFYSADDLVIDYDNAEFKIAKKLVSNPAESTIKATFEYITVFTPFRDVASVIDGRWDTQVQTEFYAQPPAGYNYAILDLGAAYNIQALDIVAGFYKPDEYRKFDIEGCFSIQYSLNGTDFYEIGDETHNFKLTGGGHKSFEENDLGTEFSARYLKLIIEDVKKLEYGVKKDADGNIIQSGVWVVAFTEIAAYNDVVIKSESYLIPTTYLSGGIDLTGIVSGAFPTTINVDSTEGFDSSGTAYIDNGDGTFDSFTYTGITATSFTGVAGLSESHYNDDMVVQEVEGDTTLYDYDGLLPSLGDRLYKKMDIDESYLYTQEQLDYVTKRYLKEFYKNHSKIAVDVLYAPHLQVGQTIKVVDTYNSINANYFIESIKDNNGFYSLTLAKYPA